MLSFLFYLSVLFDCSFQHINCRHACEDLFWVYISQSVMCRLWPRIPRRIEYRALFMTGSKKNKKGKWKNCLLDYCWPRTENRYCSTRAHSESTILSFLWLLSLSLYNKQKKYELHSQRIWASISLERNCDVKAREYEYFLLEWLVKLTVKWVSEQGSGFCVRIRSGQHI